MVFVIVAVLALLSECTAKTDTPDVAVNITGIALPGARCDFEDLCAWKWNTSIPHGFRIVNSVEANASATSTTFQGPIADANNKTQGHFLYLNAPPGTRELHNVWSPMYISTGEKCRLELSVFMASMGDGIVKVVVETVNKTSWIIAEKPGNNFRRWDDYSFKVGRISQEFNIILEIVPTYYRTKTKSEHSAIVAIDNIKLNNCFPGNSYPEAPPVKACTPLQFQCDNLTCIDHSHVCDFIPNCEHGEDEEQNCDKVPLFSHCNFEDGWCGWSNKSKHLNGLSLNWTRHCGSTPTRHTGPSFDHTYRNVTGMYAFVDMSSKKMMGAAAVMESAVFHRPPSYHSNVMSPYYNSCHIRFHYHQFGPHSGSLSMNLVEMHQKENHSTNLWWSYGDKGDSWFRQVVVLPNITRRYFVIFEARRGIALRGDIALDDISMSPECFGIGVPPIEVKDYDYNRTEPDVSIDEHKDFINKTYYLLTSCGIEGRGGPKQENCTAAYNNTATRVTVLDKLPMAGVQEWVVPETGYYTIIAKGAKGGKGSDRKGSSRGAAVRLVVELNKGQRMYVLVGQEGTSACSKDLSTKTGVCQPVFSADTNKSIQRPPTPLNKILTMVIAAGGGGGGGGTFVYMMVNNKAVPLVVAGGGGGLGLTQGIDDGRQYGQGEKQNKTHMSGNMYGNSPAGAGGGWSKNKETSWRNYTGEAIMQGARGGFACLGQNGQGWGGFGGGGGGCTAGGGGGGYSGGDAWSEKDQCGEGGSSYIGAGDFGQVQEGEHEDAVNMMCVLCSGGDAWSEKDQCGEGGSSYIGAGDFGQVQEGEHEDAVNMMCVLCSGGDAWSEKDQCGEGGSSYIGAGDFGQVQEGEHEDAVNMMCVLCSGGDAWSEKDQCGEGGSSYIGAGDFGQVQEGEHEDAVNMMCVLCSGGDAWSEKDQCGEGGSSYIGAGDFGQVQEGEHEDAVNMMCVLCSGGDAWSEKDQCGEGGSSFIGAGDFGQVQEGEHEGSGAVYIIPAISGCQCDYRCVAMDELRQKIRCLCPLEWYLSKDGVSCVLPDAPTSILHITAIVVCAAVSVLFMAMLAAWLYCRYQRKRNGRMRRRMLNGPDLQLNRLREGSHSMMTEFNPNYEFGGATYTIRDLKDIPRDHLRLVKALGQGAFGEVYQGFFRHRDGDAVEMPVAVKTLPELSTNQAESDFLMEALIMSKFNHPNIVHFIGVCFDKHPRFIVLELLAGGDLKTFLRESRPKPERPSPLLMKDLLICSMDIAKGCKYMEENRFIHRDIAARNCLLTTKGPGRVVKIADFGMARDIYRADYYRKGGKAMLPIKWMPPEAFLDGIFTTKTDVWSFGVLLWEVMSLGYMPYTGCANRDVMQLVTSGGRLEPPSNCPGPLYGIMTQCWHPKPEERPTFATILERLDYCIQDPDVMNAPLPVFYRPPSSERDATIMRPPAHENSCLSVPRNADYLVPLPCVLPELPASPSNHSVDKLLSNGLYDEDPDLATDWETSFVIPESRSTQPLLDERESTSSTDVSDKPTTNLVPNDKASPKNHNNNNNNIRTNLKATLSLDASNLGKQSLPYLKVNVTPSHVSHAALEQDQGRAYTVQGASSRHLHADAGTEISC